MIPIRWTAGRKAAVVLMVQRGEMKLAEAMRLFEITPEEWASWVRLYRKDGAKALKTTKVQNYRSVIFRPKKDR